MIQFNLLPDVKIEYMKARRKQRTTVMLSVLIATVLFVVFVVSFVVVNVAQKKHLANLQQDIDTAKKELQDKKDLSKIVTIQNQLNSLPAIHAQKPVASRVFTYIQQVTPANTSISSLVINFSEQTITIQGSADGLATVNRFTDTLKFTTYTAAELRDGVPVDASQAQKAVAFSNVVLEGFAVSDGTQQQDVNKKATFTVKLKYDMTIFASDKAVALAVPSQVTTRSETQKPDTIFQINPQNSQQEQ